nr:hypothetical protein [Candidatus Sigynarchaeota archaeon]
LREGHLDMVVGTAAGLFYSVNDAIHPEFASIITEIPRIVPPDPKRGSIQGPSEVAWGYVTPVLFDWNADGLVDIIFSDINGEHSVSVNKGSNKEPSFSVPVKLRDIKTGAPLRTVWRARPALYRDGAGNVSYYCLDEDGFLAQYEKTREYSLFKKGFVQCTRSGKIRFTSLHGGAVGRARLQLFDWDRRGTLDMLVSLPKVHDFSRISGCEDHMPVGGATVAILKNRGTNDNLLLEPPEYLIHKDTGFPVLLGHHECAAEAFLHGNAIILYIGGEDGQLYSFKREEFR